MRTLISCGIFLSLWFALAHVHAADPFADKSAGKCVSIEVLIADIPGAALDKPTDEPTPEKIADLERQGKLAALARLKLATIENLSAHVQLGEMVGVATGRTFTGGGFGGGRGAGGAAAAGDGSTTSFTMRNVGTMLQATPQVEQDGSILIKLSVERSKLADAPPTADGDRGGFQPARTLQIQTQTTLRVPPGKSVVTGGQSTSGKEATQTWIVVSAKVIDAK